MIKRTFGEVKDELRRVAGQTGLQVTDARLAALTTLAQERLCTLGEWPYQYARLRFRQFGGVVALPTEYEAIVHATVADEPVDIQPPWYEFLEYGPGPQDRHAWVNLGLDLGESPVYRSPGPAGAKLTATSTSGDDTGAVQVIGLDPAGVRHAVDLALPQATSDVAFAKILQVVKPVTLGDVVLSFADDWGDTYQAAAYRGVDTCPTFRTYRFTGPGGREEQLIHAIVRRRLFPVRADADDLFITHLGALRLGVKGIALEDKGDLAGAAGAFDLAAAILRAESHLYRASRNLQPLNVSRIAALGARPDIF
jgi:hypothetical protein